MNDMDDDKYWNKSPPWKHPKYDCNKKSYKAFAKNRKTFYMLFRVANDNQIMK